MNEVKSMFPADGYYWVSVGGDPAEVAYFDGINSLFFCGDEIGARFDGKKWEKLGTVAVVVLSDKIVFGAATDADQHPAAVDIIDELREAADMHEDDLGPGMGELEIRAIAEIRKLRAERDEAIRQLTVRIEQSHSIRRSLDALELHKIPQLEAEITRLKSRPASPA